MDRRPLGRTGLEVSPVAFGTGSLGDMYGRLDDADADDLVARVVDSGINLIDTSPYYGNAEERLGRALTPSRRDRVLLATKAGRYGVDEFDFTPRRIRRSLEESLRRMRTDHVDIFQLHDVEFVDLQPVFDDSVAELLALKDEGKCRFVGMTGYPLATFRRVLEECPVDVILTHSKGTLLDDSLTTQLLPLAEQRGIGVINAAPIALGLLSVRGPNLGFDPPWPDAVERAARRMVEVAVRRGLDIAFLANQYAIQRSGAVTTAVGAGRWEHVSSAIDAASAPIDEDALAEIIALRPAPDARPWLLGLAENN